MPEAQTGADGGDFILRVKTCYTPREQIHHASVLCSGGMIQAVGGYSALCVLEESACLDMSDYHAIPGLLDTHLHGSGGFAAMDAEGCGDLEHMSLVLAEHGVTGFVLTILSAEQATMVDRTRRLAELYRSSDLPGAVPVGIHFEGPFLSLAKRGAQDASAIRPIILDEARELLDAADGHAVTMTFAPELAGSEDLIALLRERNVVPSMGHSSADEEVVRRAIDAGACRCTHLYNGMPPLDQRKAGLTSVALTDERLTIELIVDGVHVHPRMIDLACRAKPRAGVIGISDATQGGGMKDGIYRLGDSEVVIADGYSRRVSDGRLAGSCLTLDRALRNLMDYSSLSPCEVVACFTRNPAAGIALRDRGTIRPGKRADITVVDDEWNVRMTIVGGRVAYRAE